MALPRWLRLVFAGLAMAGVLASCTDQPDVGAQPESADGARPTATAAAEPGSIATPTAPQPELFLDTEGALIAEQHPYGRACRGLDPTFRFSEYLALPRSWYEIESVSDVGVLRPLAESSPVDVIPISLEVTLAGDATSATQTLETQVEPGLAASLLEPAPASTRRLLGVELDGELADLAVDLGPEEAKLIATCVGYDRWSTGLDVYVSAVQARGVSVTSVEVIEILLDVTPDSDSTGISIQDVAEVLGE